MYFLDSASGHDKLWSQLQILYTTLLSSRRAHAQTGALRVYAAYFKKGVGLTFSFAECLTILLLDNNKIGREILDLKELQTML